MQAVYQKMARRAARNAAAPSSSASASTAWADVWKWGRDAGGNLWRTTGDISDSWETHVDDRLHASGDLAKCAGPGHWNDPDMLEVGNGGMTADEYRTHMSLWAIFAAPLLAGNDVRNMSADTRSILLNKDVIAIDQDPLGMRQHLWLKGPEVDYWTRSLSGNGLAIAAVNRTDATKSVKMPWKELGVDSNVVFKDVWSGRQVKAPSDSSFTIPAHGVLLLRTETLP